MRKRNKKWKKITLEVDIGKIKIRRDKKEERSLRYEMVEKGQQEEEENIRTPQACLPAILRL